jgi:hypothetical protein
MAKKLFGGKKKKVEEPVSSLPKPVITPLSPDEVKRRRLLPRQPVSTGSILGTSSTLGG